MTKAMAFAATGMTPSKVSSTTIFQVSSVSKAISATVAAIAMTKNHSFDWDTSVGKAWDRFRPNLDNVSGDATIGDSSFLAPACVRRRAASSRISVQRKQIVVPRLIGRLVLIWGFPLSLWLPTDAGFER
ncbi:MAG: hypothetical protein EOQ33_28055 [Mesorhizobium sp.]|nr:MAG: hypothetical protein EOQ33_28055 [Mesorhizobium sp.]